MSNVTLSFKGKQLGIIQLQQGEMVIGSASESDIHIDSLALEPRHAVIETHGSQSVVRDLGSETGTLVNGQRIEQHPLADQDEILVGKFTLAFNYSDIDYDTESASGQKSAAATGAAGASGSAWIQFLSGPNIGKIVRLRKQDLQLGKSGLHTAVITWSGDGYAVTHLEGEPPTLVNDEPVGDTPHLLANGDTIQIRNIKIAFSLQ